MFYIYRITNKINGKTYVGKHEYKKLDDSYMGSGVLLKKAKKKYGMKNFKKEILVFNISKQEHANLLEETFIAAEREKVGRENCYNITDGGDGGYGLTGEKNGMYGKKHTEDAKMKISEANKGRPSSNKGKHISEETKRKMSEKLRGKPAWNKGVPMSDEQKRKLSESMKGNQNHKGKRHTKEAKDKISKVHKGKTPWNKGKQGKPCSEENKRRQSILFKGKHWKLVDGKRVWY